MSSWRILKTDVLEMPVSCERRRIDLLGKSSWRSCKFWNILRNYSERRAISVLWASATLPVFRSLSIKCWTVLPSGTMFLPKSFLHYRSKVCLDDFYLLLHSIVSTWIHIGVKGSRRPTVYTTWKIWKKKMQNTTLRWKTKQDAFFGPPGNYQWTQYWWCASISLYYNSYKNL